MTTAKQVLDMPRLKQQKIKELNEVHADIAKAASRVHILDKNIALDWIQQRQKLGIDMFDEVWEGVYVVPPLATNPHQGQSGAFYRILHEVVEAPGRGSVYPGANVSDRRKNWKKNFRCPDNVVVLKGSRAIDCGTHWLGGPDFLVEIHSPNDDTMEKIPFYSRLKVQELLIVHRDTRSCRLFRHDGKKLVEVKPSLWQAEEWLVSEVVPLAFRRAGSKKNPKVEIRRTDNLSGHWAVS